MVPRPKPNTEYVVKSPNTDLYPRFSDIEIDRRRVLVREFVAQHELNGLVVFS
jgi:hypothetical protein